MPSSNLDSLHGERVLPVCQPQAGIWPESPVVSSALFFVNFEIQNDVLATVEAGDGTGWGFGTLFFRMQFVIGIGIQAAETVVAGVIGVTAAFGTPCFPGSRRFSHR